MKIRSLFLCVVIWSTAEAQSIDPVSLILAKAIKSVDLKVQRMQNETLILQRAQQVAEQELAKVKLKEISNWQQQFSALYAGYFTELKQVKPVISNGLLVKRILALQTMVEMEYRKFGKHASRTALFNNSKDIRQMLDVVLSMQLSMKDADRLTLLYTLRDAMSHCLETMQAFNQQASELAEKRARVKAGINDVKRLHGIQ